MFTDHFARHESQRTCRQGRCAGPELLFQHAHMIAVGHEADVLTLGLLGGAQPKATRDFARFRLCLMSHRQHEARQHRALDAPQEIALILGRIEPSQHHARLAPICQRPHARVVARGQPRRIDVVGLVQQVAKLRERVAAHAGYRRAAARVLLHEIIEHVVAKTVNEIGHIVRDAEFLAHPPRVAGAVQRAAGAVGNVLAVFVQLHRHAHHVTAGFHQHGRRDG